MCFLGFPAACFRIICNKVLERVVRERHIRFQVCLQPDFKVARSSLASSNRFRSLRGGLVLTEGSRVAGGVFSVVNETFWKRKCVQKSEDRSFEEFTENELPADGYLLGSPE